MRLFDRYGDGGEEITAVLGLISDRVEFSTWAPLLPLGIRDVTAIVGPEPVEALAAHYESGKEGEPELDRALAALRQAVALFTWLKIIPTLDAMHDNTGRMRRIGENEKGLTALEQYKDETNILHLAYEAVDALIEELDRGAFEFWTESRKCRQRAGLLVRTKEQFDEYYVIGSHRLFLTLLPMIREVQSSAVAPALGEDVLARLLAGDGSLHPALADAASRAVVLLAMKKAVERLPVEVLPDGIVQVNQSVPVNQKLRAEKEARASVAASLGADASRCLQQVEDIVAGMKADGEPVDYFMPGPIIHSKGITF